MNKKNLFITGTPRSGTTWLAEMLSFAPNLNYISGEPFNLDVSEKLFGFKAPYWYYHITGTENEDFKERLKAALNQKWEINDLFRRIAVLKKKKVKDWKPYLRILKLIYFKNITSKVNLIKDPVAFFSTKHIAELFNARVIYITRHPCAFISSMGRVGWYFEFSDLIENNAFEHLPVELKTKLYEAELNNLDRNILAWNIIHYEIKRSLKEDPDCLVVSHETLSLNPVTEFKKLYDELGLQFTSTAERRIRAYTKSTNKVNAKNNEVHVLKRNSKENIKTWKRNLSREEQSYILRETEELREFFNYF